MSSIDSEIFKNFLIEIRGLLISRDYHDNLEALWKIISALDDISNEERLFLMNHLVTFDFFPHYQRLITTDELLMKTTLKVSLCFMENEEIFKRYFLDLLKAHFRSFLFMAKTEITNDRIAIDCVTFIQILQERSLNWKLRFGKKNPLINIHSDFYDAFRIALRQCRNKDIRTLTISNLSQILLCFMGKESPVKYASYLCCIMSFASQVTTDSVTTTAIMVIRNVLPNIHPGNFMDHLWIDRMINGIQQHFMSLKNSNLHARIFHIYFLIALINGHYFDIFWIYENIIKFFLSHNGLQYVMDSMKASIEQKYLLGVYLSKQLVSHVVALVETTKTKDTFLIAENLSETKAKYDKIWSRSVGLEYWSFNYTKYDFISELNFILIDEEDWKALITFLYIGVTLVQKIDSTVIFVNMVSLLQMALIKEFEISDQFKEMMMEIYCKTYWTCSPEAKASLEEGVIVADKFFQEYLEGSKENPNNNLHLLAYICQKNINDDEEQKRQMMNILLQKPDLHLHDNLINVFIGHESDLLHLLTFQHITPVAKHNIIKIFLKPDLNATIVDEVVDIIFKCRDPHVAAMYLPIIMTHFHKISKQRQEILNFCYFNHGRRPESATLDKASRVTMINFFAKSLITLGRSISQK